MIKKRVYTGTSLSPGLQNSGPTSFDKGCSASDGNGFRWETRLKWCNEDRLTVGRAKLRLPAMKILKSLVVSATPEPHALYLGSTTVTSRAKSCDVLLISLKRIHSGGEPKCARTEDGWMATTVLSRTVRYRPSGESFATFAKKPATKHLSHRVDQQPWDYHQPNGQEHYPQRRKLQLGLHMHIEDMSQDHVTDSCIPEKVHRVEHTVI